MADAVLLEQRDKVAILTINKPKANQLSGEVFETIRKYLDPIEMDKNTLAVVITGSGDKIFSAGADLSSGFGDFSAVDFLKRGQDVWNKVEFFQKPIIAAMNGHALGGGFELALACHFRFLKKGARVGLTETNLGIMPGYGGSLRLPRVVGRSKALEMMFLGKQVEAEEALALGLVDRLCEEGKTLDDALAFANELAKRPPLSVRSILKVTAMSPYVSPDLHLKVEREELAKLFTTKDMMEGMTAFAQKREPQFKGE
ncbi:MAG TPA: enoyl-CoA hydratase-related protein [Spirochaetota bacterium]|nr:enoyl-CoA hydratase-related protein [Spirochaetota bacterium]HPC40770.1 enoyl-CoA hydratase-related protein [Spirochaetota bacterium]HPL19024.1 enoyl-CoA hydratase-related protein [Spirochaetota bacterium]HQF10372.1 enoyl-CoA hydratase-related protein [Spirochaetota bacterium]HQH99245.1 enoyl-CoA hydratase-related protein [Spirochaetota bacterium]